MSLTGKLASAVAGVGMLASAENGNAQGNLVAHWGFDEPYTLDYVFSDGRTSANADGKTTYDSTGNGNNALISGNVMNTNGGFSGNSLLFNNGYGRAEVAKTISLNLTEQVSINAQVVGAIGGIGNGGTLLYGYPNGTIFGSDSYFMAVKNRHLFGGVRTGEGAGNWTTIEGTTIIQKNQLSNLTLTYDGQFIRGFLNGNLDAIAPKTGSLSTLSNSALIGSGALPGSPYSIGFTGVMDDLSIYSTAIPEPTTSLLLLGGLGAMALNGMRKKE